MDSVLLLVLVGAVVLAIVMSAFAWRVLRRDRSRSAARVARLEALSAPEDHTLSFDEPVDDEPLLIDESFDEPLIETRPMRAPSAPLFVAPEPQPRRLGAMVMVIIVFMAIGAGTVYGLYGPAWPAGFALREATASADTTPVELVSLTHRRDGGDFVVTGLVQNPHPRAATPALSVVVYLFDDRGQFLTSATGTLETGRIHPSDLSPFHVRVTNAGTVARYRVGFRQDDGRAFAHVDRRSEGINGTTLATVEASR